MTHIRPATNQDRDDIREVYSCAFSESEQQMVSTLAVNLLAEKSVPETFSLVAEVDGAVVGHIAFSPLFIDGNKSWSGYILAPLAVSPAYQNHHVGSKLVENGMKRLSNIGVNIVFVYGDPDYYSKFGFNADAASGYTPPYALQYPFAWQAVILNEDVVTGSTKKIACVAPLSAPGLW